VYKAAIRAMVRRNIGQLNQGNSEPLLRMAAADAELSFPGDNSWSRMFHPLRESGRSWHSTHRGTTELESFAQRFVENGLRIDIEDILVNGPPWRTRICVRATDGANDEAGNQLYANRVTAFIEARWGRICRWEDYLDTERVAAWDQLVGADHLAGSRG
jgi:ketosteroid isomerase-like protein